MTDSILDSVKILLGIVPECKDFDESLIMNINSVFLTLNQIGVGTTYIYSINSNRQTWDEFINGNEYEAVKMYIYQKVRLNFDPPANSFVLEAINRSIAEYEWRLMIHAENGGSK